MAPLASHSTYRPSSPGSTDSERDNQLDTIKMEKLTRRRFTKHVIERKRRDRINSSMDQLKNLILKECQKDPEHYDKMEKADILDMTLQFIRANCSSRNVRRTPQYPMATATYHHHVNQQQHHRLHAAPVNMPLPGLVAPVPTVVRNAGYQACREEVTRFMQMSAAPAHITTGVMKNLSVNIPVNNVTVPHKTDNLYKKYKHRATCSQGFVQKDTSSTTGLLQVAPPSSEPVWRPF